jgi:hypothetical protein
MKLNPNDCLPQSLNYILTLPIARKVSSAAVRCRGVQLPDLVCLRWAIPFALQCRLRVCSAKPRDGIWIGPALRCVKLMMSASHSFTLSVPSISLLFPRQRWQCRGSCHPTCGFESFCRLRLSCRLWFYGCDVWAIQRTASPPYSLVRSLYARPTLFEPSFPRTPTNMFCIIVQYLCLTSLEERVGTATCYTAR